MDDNTEAAANESVGNDSIAEEQPKEVDNSIGETSDVKDPDDVNVSGSGEGITQFYDFLLFMTSYLFNIQQQR